MSEKKYKFVQATQEEIEKFNKDFQDLLEKHSLAAETQPSIARIGETGEFSLKGIMVLSKKMEAVEAEVISPIQSDELNKKN